MEEEYYADRTTLRQLMRHHPNWTIHQYMTATGRSRSWVKKWRKRLRNAAPDEDSVLHGLSRARHAPPEPIAAQVVKRLLEIRDHPPGNLRRVPGPKALLYYLHQDQQLKAKGWHVPTSTRTVWQILDRHHRIFRTPQATPQPVERPEPMSSWQWDFKDVSSVPADPDGKQQHVVETFNVVDVGTSILLEAIVRDDFTSETALVAATHTFLEHGLPERVTFDRDPRFVGSWTGRDFPTSFVRFLLCLDIDVNLCPPHRPDKNAFVERYHRSYGEECLALHHPQTCPHAQEVTQAYRYHYNWERPNQAITCNNQPPRLAFPTLPKRPPLPTRIDPDHWLHAIAGHRYRRRISSNGTFTLDHHTYYVRRDLKGQSVTVLVDATHRQLIVEHNKQPIKSLPIKGLYDEVWDFEDYFAAIREEARTEWRRVMQRRRVTM